MATPQEPLNFLSCLIKIRRVMFGQWFSLRSAQCNTLGRQCSPDAIFFNNT